YIVMEFLDGQDLRAVLKERCFTANEIFRIMRPVIDALEKVHAMDIIHCDISPDNIMLLKNGSVKLMDFGAARVVNLDDEKSRSVVLKAGYAPEEQYRPKGILGPWSDIYALCATMYKCITGITPDDALERSHKDTIQWPSELGIEITETQEAVLKKGMAVNAEERFQNIGEMRAMLDRQDTKIHAVDFETDGDVVTEYWNRKEKKEGKEEKEEKEDKRKEDTGEQELPDDGKLREPQDPSDRKRKMLFGAGVLTAAVVIGGAVLFAGEKAMPSGTGADTETASGFEANTETPAAPYQENTGSSLAEIYPLDEYIHLILNAGDNISVKGFNDAVETLKERLDIFSGDKEFGLEVVEDKVDLYLPKSELGNYDLPYMLRCYLTRATDLYAFKNEDVGYNPEKFVLNREDMEEVMILEGTLDGVNAEEYGIASETYPYIKIILTDACAEKHKEEIESWGDSFCFAQDMSVDSYYYFNTFAEGDGKTFYILNKDLEGPCLDLTYYNLTHEPLEKSFRFWIDLSYRGSWDDVETAEEVGENQCNMEAITGKTVTACYTSFTDKLSAGELLDTEKALKERLDALGVPYAFGWEEQEGKTIAAVKTGVERMGQPIIATLGNWYGVTLRAGLIEEKLYNSDAPKFIYEKNADDTYRIRLEVDSSSARTSIKEFFNQMEASGGGELFLNVNDRPFLSASVDAAVSENSIVFDQVYLPEISQITDETLWVVKYVETMVTGTKLPRNMSCFQGDYFMISDNPLDMNDLEFGVSYEALEKEWENALYVDQEEAATVTIDGSTVRVTYDLEVNEEIPEAVLRLGKETYEKIDFENSAFRELAVYFIKENDEQKERVRVFFTKACNTSTADEKERYIYVHGIFTNGRLKRYTEQFQMLKDADPFYQKMEAAYPYEYDLWTYE
ncbi:MAG: serine/threonine protein kinase, partial [Enterocloster sp.]